MRYVLTLMICLWGMSAQAMEVLRFAGLPVDVVILGEVHDNPAHHAKQASILRELAPKAVIFEMLTPEEAAQLAGVPRKEAAMAAASAEFHWSNIADYADVLAASEGVIVGAALPRGDVRQAFSDGAAAVFGANAEQFGLETPVPDAQLAARKEMQFESHCQAMPLEMMGGMVEAQRLRDAAFARAVLDAQQTYGSPVALITGNGHARRDWGVPAALALAAPDVSVITIGQSEAGRRPLGGFDAFFDAPAVDRPDPCDAFK